MTRRYGEAALPEHFRTFDTICSATQDRQDAVLRLIAEPLDLMVVIGGGKPSHTTHPPPLCPGKGAPPHIQEAARLAPGEGGSPVFPLGGQGGGRPAARGPAAA